MLNEYRRFELINSTNEIELSKLIKKKRLSHEDIMLILQTIKMNDNYRNEG